MLPVGAFRVGLLGGLGVLTALAIGGAITTLATVITYVGFALFLALGLNPMVVKLESLSVPRPAAVGAVVLSALALFAGFVLAIIPVIIEQTTTMYSNILTMLGSFNSFDEALASLQRIIPIEFLDVSATFDSLVEFIGNPANLAGIGGGVFSVGAGFANAVFGGIMVSMMTVYFIISLPSITRQVTLLVPATRRERFDTVARQIEAAVGQYVAGQFTQGLVNGVLSFVVLTIMGAHYPALFAFVAFMFSLVPLVGTLTGSIAIVLTQFIVAPDNTGIVIAMGVYYLVYMQIEAYLIGPYIMKRAVRVPALVVIVSALAGGALLGVLGALVAIPVAASLLIVLRQVVIPLQDER